VAVQEPPNARNNNPAPGAGTAAPRRINASPWSWLLVLPFIGVLVPAFYNKKDPELGGVPFFYWYQMLWIVISVAVTIIVYRATRGER
jgi:uncharacterized protein DUF3311